jgi:hypothetical protein
MSVSGAAQAVPPPSTADLELAAKWMTGSFSSEAQAKRDTSFLDIRLHIVPVWPNRTEARWFYVEQAAAGALERPYRQRVYRLMMSETGTLESAVFTLPAPLRFAGAWREKAPLSKLTPDSLSEREGCSVYLEREGKVFRGGTAGRRCASELRGAAYATSEVAIDEHGMTTWDRGWDAAGKQAWGSTAGPYEFRRVEGR